MSCFATRPCLAAPFIPPANTPDDADNARPRGPANSTKTTGNSLGKPSRHLRNAESVCKNGVARFGCRPNVHRQYLRCSLTAFYGPNRSCDLWEGGFSTDQEVNLEHIFRRSRIMAEMWATTIYTTTCYNRSMHYNVRCFVLFQTTPKLLQNLKRKPLSKELYDSTL